MKKIAEFDFDYRKPLVCTAIHNGHLLSPKIKNNLAVSEDIQIYEEDPFTERFTKGCGNRIIVNFSRFEVDLNRSPEKCVYLKPEDAWGLKTRKNPPSDCAISQSLEKYHGFYAEAKSYFSEMEKKFGRFFVYDIHSYNHHRLGSEAEFDDPEKNPEIIIGTNNMPEKCFPLVKKIQEKLTSYNYFGRSLDARINVKFPGGYFSKWIYNNFPGSACCIAIEFKKIWMDEWTSEVYEDKLQKLIEALYSTFDLIESEITKY
ncbi:MAG: N-formylglutamate amidohydrolase [Candidatus Cloacimonadales bacterium]|nr:N-formylglutamate amidohydrolase [Candidatus Cloacimonadales bacterium]